MAKLRVPVASVFPLPATRDKGKGKFIKCDSVTHFHHRDSWPLAFGHFGPKNSQHASNGRLFLGPFLRSMYVLRGVCLSVCVCCCVTGFFVASFAYFCLGSLVLLIAADICHLPLAPSSVLRPESFGPKNPPFFFCSVCFCFCCFVLF